MCKITMILLYFDIHNHDKYFGTEHKQLGGGYGSYMYTHRY